MMNTVFYIMWLIARGTFSALGTVGRATIALVGIAGVTMALANYTMTQGSGTSFGSIVVSTVHYAQQLICDPATPANCGAVKAGNTATTTDVAQVVSDPNVLAAVNSGVGTPGSSTPSTNIVIGCNSITAEQTARTNGQDSNAACDAVGKQIIMPFANPENFLNGQVTTAMTGTSDTAVTGMGAQGAGVRNYITGCTFSNSHATVGTMMVLKDGAAGTVIAQAPAAPAFGGATVVFNPPIKTTANTALNVANITTGANTFLSCTGYKGA